MASHYEAPIRRPLVTGEKSYHDVTLDVVAPVEGKANKLWWVVFSIALSAFGWGLGCMIYTVSTGIGTWGLNKTVGWAWDITNFVWWVGIGHAGTLISAVLLLFRQKWRMAINRSAEAMTIFAVFMAGLFPLIHMGRLWLGYWVLPLPNQFGSLWVNFNSPLLWDVFAISTYLSVSLVFWYIGLIPDFATIRDRAKRPIPKKMYSILSFGWSGRAKNWNRFELVSLVLAGLATPLVFSVHSIVSFDFATSVIPGWHTTIFPPYFVAGAVFSGFAMVQTLLLVMRKAMGLEAYIHHKHVEYMNIVIMVTGSIVGTAYITELFISWYSGVEYEAYAFINRATGPYWWAYFAMMTCNVVSPQLMWFRKLRRSLIFTFIISIVVNIGMWFERYVIIVTSIHRDYLPSSWSMHYPSHIDLGVYIGTIGLFFVFFLLFARFFPVLALNELKTILKSSGESYKNAPDGHSPEPNPTTMVEVPVAAPVVEEVKVEAPVNDALSDLLGTIGTADESKKDDLKKLSGVGPAFETALNDAGIWTFEQISKMTKSEYDMMDAVTGKFPGKAEKEDWASQAKELMNANN